MIIFSTVQSIFISTYHISITIVRLQNSSFYFLRISIWHAASSSPIQPSIWKFPPRIDSALYDHLQHCTIHFHIIFSYRYNHCEATTQQVILISDLFIENFNMMCLPHKRLIWYSTKNRISHVWSSPTCIVYFPIFFHISITIVRILRNRFIDICLTVRVFQYDLLPPPH